MKIKISIHLLAKQSAAVTPIKPKNGADVGQVSYDTVAIFDQQLRMTTKKEGKVVTKRKRKHDTKNEPRGCLQFSEISIKNGDKLFATHHTEVPHTIILL